LRAIKRAIKEQGEDEKRFAPQAVLGTISRAKGDARMLAAYREETGNAWYETTVAGIWTRYDALLRKDKALDFDDLLLMTWKLLDTNAAVRSRLQDRWQYLHVDEYQDTNKVQYELIRLLADEHANVFCVGDLDQAVYGWRGATIENILEFERSFPNATILKLEQNYRSTNTIVTVSNEIIKKNRRRKDKTLFTDQPDGDKMTLTVGWNERDEAERVAERAGALIDAGVPGDDIAILYRANFQSRVLEDAFLNAGIPYRVLGTRFFDRKEVKDVLSYVRAALNPDSGADIARIINVPARGIGKITLAKLQNEGRSAFSGAVRIRIDDFFVILEDIRRVETTRPASECLAFALERSGIATLLGGKNEEDVERLQNTKELVSLAATRYDSEEPSQGILHLLEDAALATDQDELDQRTDGDRTGQVTLMTIHAAKGLEFRHVCITGLEEGLFPHEHFSDRARTSDDEEERRLFYVALTRAKEQVHLSYAQARTVFGTLTHRIPSEFLLDIDEKYIEAADDEQGRGAVKKVVYLD
jgi:DNA helicase-2/ATP-dependent DNA helicase PcrA